MYTDFFGLHEKPFELSPDPRYLYLSASHREVLGHLIYGIEQGEGFIAITGEVGTGKTTLCRTLLDRLGSDSEVAFLFNPHLSPVDLLKSINAEFGLSTFGHSIPELVEVLNEFLLDKHTQHRSVLLIVDEAQTLSTETLEQIRLLSNLETRTSKLLQIVLLGQPELDEKLDTHELRQLRQRITVRWKLGTLAAAETRDYVHHRLRIGAGRECRVFTDAALASIHRLSGGVPRLINVLCDRALLAAYGDNVRQVDRARVAAVAREVWPQRRGRVRSGLKRAGWAALAAALSVAGFAVGLRWGGPAETPPGDEDRALPVGRAAPAPIAAVGAAPPARSAAQPDPTPPRTPPSQRGVAAATPPSEEQLILDALLPLRTPEASNAAVLAAALEAWHLAPVAGDDLSRAALMDALTANELSTLRLESGNVAGLLQVGLPAIVQLRVPGGEIRSVLVRRIEAEDVYLRGVITGETVRTTLRDIEVRWTGDAYAIWRDYAGLPSSIAFGDSGPQVEWLQQALAQTGHFTGIPHGVFNDATLAAVRAFQTASGIASDGRVGPVTKIRIYQALAEYMTPVLVADAAASIQP
jgi:general secretion pathway protein A